MYRLLCINQYHKIISLVFQSPNGVQIAFEVILNRIGIFSVSITKRCTDCFIMSKYFEKSANRFNHQTVYRLLSGNNELYLYSDHVSITKRCTDCFRDFITDWTENNSGFNHQTVYRLLCYPCGPYGRSVCFNHQTVYRLL